MTGRLKIRAWEANGKQGTSVDIDAESIGHDLRWGTSAFLSASRAASAERGRDLSDHAATRGALAPPTVSTPDGDSAIGNDEWNTQDAADAMSVRASAPF